MNEKIENVQLSEQDLRAAIKEQEGLIREAQMKIYRIEDKLTKLIAEFEIGDKVHCSNFQVNTVCVVTGAKWKYGSKVAYFGKRIKNDGSLGAQEYELYGTIKKAEED